MNGTPQQKKDQFNPTDYALPPSGGKGAQHAQTSSNTASPATPARRQKRAASFQMKPKVASPDPTHMQHQSYESESEPEPVSVMDGAGDYGTVVVSGVAPHPFNCYQPNLSSHYGSTSYGSPSQNKTPGTHPMQQSSARSPHAACHSLANIAAPTIPTIKKTPASLSSTTGSSAGMQQDQPTLTVATTPTHTATPSGQSHVSPPAGSKTEQFISPVATESKEAMKLPSGTLTTVGVTGVDRLKRFETVMAAGKEDKAYQELLGSPNVNTLGNDLVHLYTMKHMRVDQDGSDDAMREERSDNFVRGLHSCVEDYLREFEPNLIKVKHDMIVSSAPLTKLNGYYKVNVLNRQDVDESEDMKDFQSVIVGRDTAGKTTRRLLYFCQPEMLQLDHGITGGEPSSTDPFTVRDNLVTDKVLLGEENYSSQYLILFEHKEMRLYATAELVMGGGLSTDQHLRSIMNSIAAF